MNLANTPIFNPDWALRRKLRINKLLAIEAALDDG
jgi:hypothetical protein